MFTGIKDKILNVTKNVSFLVSDDKSSKLKNESLVNFNAGASILQHFQDQWEIIHDLNEANAKKASEAAQNIDKINRKNCSNRQNLETIAHILKHSNLLTNISHCFDQINNLYNVCEKVEEGLCELENLMEQIEFEKIKRQHRFHLETYRTKKEGELQSLKHNLQQDYDKKVEEHEATKKSRLEERQRVFQEAFKNDLEIYKSFGTIPKVNLPKNGALLEEIQLDFDETELDKFFNSSSDSTS